MTRFVTPPSKTSKATQRQIKTFQNAKVRDLKPQRKVDRCNKKKDMNYSSDICFSGKLVHLILA